MKMTNINRFVFLVAFLILLVPVSLHAQTPIPPKPDPEFWKQISPGVGDDSLAMYYLRRDSLISISSDIIKFWMREYTFENKAWVPGYRLFLIYGDCRLMRASIRRHDRYDGSDRLIKNDSWEDDRAPWDDLNPDSSFYNNLRYICSFERQK